MKEMIYGNLVGGLAIARGRGKREQKDGSRKPGLLMRLKAHRKRRRVRFFFMLISFLVASLDAPAQGIVYFSYGAGIRVGSARTSGEYGLDLDDNGSVDFRFVATVFYFNAEPQGRNTVLGYPTSIARSYFGIRRLGAGVDISSGPQSGLEWVGYRDDPFTGPYLIGTGFGYYFGDFSSRLATGSGESFPRQEFVAEGYMGVQFYASDGLHYGWIRVRGGYESYGTILDYAYNTVPGQGLAAGVVPEPSTWALIGIGAVAFCFARRKRDALRAS